MKVELVEEALDERSIEVGLSDLDRLDILES